MPFKTWNDVTPVGGVVEYDPSTNSTTVHINRTFSYLGAAEEVAALQEKRGASVPDRSEPPHTCNMPVGCLVF